MQTRLHQIWHLPAKCGFDISRLGFFLFVLSAAAVSAQTFTGTNTPGTFQDFNISLVPGTTNLAILVPGTTTNFSDLLLKRGAAPADTNYDFIALANGQTNSLNLEMPEFVLTNYVLRVRTPTNSQTHSFVVTVATNVTDLRTAARPATKSLITQLSGTITSNSWQFFRVDAPTNLPCWRVVLYSTNTALTPDLYAQWNQLPSGTNWLKRSTNANPDTLFFTNSEAIAGGYIVGVYLPATTNTTPVRYTLAAEFADILPLTWDPGLTHGGTQIFVNTNMTGGDYYFRIVAQNTSLGAWRTALNVLGGEGNVYLSRGTLPTVVSNLFKSERVGSDGFVVPSTVFNAGEDWYLMVRADPASQWTLVTGEPFVTDLGMVAAGGSSGSGDVPMGAEGMRFFKTTVPATSVAWRLWLNGLTNALYVRKAAVPVSSTADLSQNGQMLVVPSYLVGGQLYFVGVGGNPGATINLDSRQQAFADIPFESITNLTINGFGYATFRVQVPFNQIAWQASVAVTNGNANIAVRRNLVPNEWNNDAYSEAPGLVTDSITLVPPTLSDGTFFITVYSTSNYACALQSGTPEITPIDFSSVTTNTDTNRVGWRFFKASDISQQLGALGWDLLVTNFSPGTKIALRRNGTPSLWNYRMPPPGLSGAAGVYDYVSTGDFLQRPGHQADVWYVGVFNTNAALGNFTLITRPLTADQIDFDGGTMTRSSVPAGKWQFFRVDVPANTLGWDVRVMNVTAGLPQLVVSREALPTWPLGTIMSGSVTSSNWPTGTQWPAGSDWTTRNLSADGSVSENNRILTMGMQRPLEPATYYVGVISSTGSSNAMSYSVLSRGIGPGSAIPVQDLDYQGGSATNNALTARDVAVYRVVMSTNIPSWKVKLTATSGDVLLAVGKDRVPNITASVNSSVTNTYSAGKRMLRAGNEHYVELPLAGTTNLAPGSYYLVVASEGLASQANPTWIGPGNASYVLTSIGRLPETDLGTLISDDLLYNGQLEGGESAAFHFHNLADTLGFELSLNNRVGNPVLVSRGDLPLPDPGIASPTGVVPGDPYGNEGGEYSALECSPAILTVSGPFMDETVMMKARGSGGGYSNASYNLRVRKLVADPLAFDGGSSMVVNQTNIYQFFRVDVPANALGWDARIVNVAPGGSPKLIACHDYLALNILTPGFPGQGYVWPSGYMWIADKDWTQRSYSSNGSTNEDGRILAVGMGRPLQPGTYYLAVFNPNAPLPMSYTVQSRGIGDGFVIPVVDLPFAGGTVTNSALAPREAAYYRVVIPPGASSWQCKLTTQTGDALLLALSNCVPSIVAGRPAMPGKSMQKPGNEHYVLLPVANQTSLLPITNYLAVASEGTVDPASSTRIGTNSTSYTLQSRGELQITAMGALSGADLVQSNALEGGEVRAYQFTVPPGLSGLEAQLLNPTGNPTMVLRPGSWFPDPGAPSPVSGAGSVLAESYGNEGGYSIVLGNGNANTNLISVSSPTNGVYTLFVKARAQSAGSYSNATYTLVVRSVGYMTVDFDGGSCGITNQTGNTWKYFRIDVPTNALGWDVRLVNIAAGSPRIVVRRDMFPDSLLTGPWGLPGTVTNWPTTNQWAAGSDWTRRTTSANGQVTEDGRILAVGIGSPLQPGTYYVGIINSQGTNAMTYTLLSRGIGDGMKLPVTDLAFNGGCLTNQGLAPREAAYYRVVVPTNSTGCKIRLAATEGESMLLTLKDHVPNIDTGRYLIPTIGKYMQKAGNEHYVLLPATSTNFAAAGTYYLAVVGEGVNPPATLQIGAGNSSYVLSCIGGPVITNLGILGSTDMLTQDSLEGGESKFYQFTVLSGTGALEVRLENRIGNPVMVLLTNSSLPDPGAVMVGVGDTYGNEGGLSPSDVNTNILTVPSPATNLFTVAVKGRFTATGVYPDAHYTLRVRRVPIPDLNFTPEFNTNGLNNVASGLLLDSQRAFYRVVVPDNVNGAPVLGWQLDVSQLSGLAYVRVRKDALPSDAFTTGVPFTPNAAIIASPFLTNGTWYVEVKGSNSTAFTLTSSAVALQRPAWSMPGVGEASSTPSLTAPDFADSGLDTNGVPLPGDQGIDLPQGRYHYYAVQVPTNNGALMRVQLDAISGNSDVYLRVGAVPTYSHATNGSSGVMADRYVTGTVTEYANWVPFNGQTDMNLASGRYYLAVRASSGANARYRLRLSNGHVQDLDFSTGSAANQIVAGGDWRYYRLQVPMQLPANWLVTFSQQAGDVVMHVRDTMPPGNGVTTNTYDIKDWASDQKNSGSYTSYDPPGTYSFSTPMVRPGAVYYLGFRGKSDSTFSVSSSGSGTPLPDLPVINFYGGFVTNFLAPYSQVAYRIPTPPDALRWRDTAVHSNLVQLFIENGSMPAKGYSDDWRSAVANSSIDQLLTAYPWLANQNFYMVVTNTSSSFQPFSFTMNGSSLTADSDGDGLPDWWEVKYMLNLGSGPTGDYDGDGVSNGDEYIEGTNPADRYSLRPRLTTTCTNGIVTRSPDQTNYTSGSTVILNATPAVGFNFIGWSGSASGTNNPLAVTLTSNRTVTAIFKVPGDDFAQRVPITGWSNTVFSSNTNATKETGEPFHAGNFGGHSIWWTWTALNSCNVSVTTAGSPFNTLLAVYTGTAVTNLTLVASNDNDGAANTSRVTFAATAGVAYAIAVDGFNGAMSNVTLTVKQAIQPLVLGDSARLLDGRFQFSLTATAGYDYDILASTDLVHWQKIATLPNWNGKLPFVDPAAALFPYRFYRAAQGGLSSQAPLLINPARTNGSQFTFTVMGPPSQAMRIQSSTNLTDWVTLATITNTTGTFPYVDSSGSNATRQLYRAIVP